LSRRVLVTHADEPLGRRLVKVLFHDPGIERIVATGSGPPPRAFDAFLRSGRRLAYARADLARHRSVADLFGSPRVRDAAPDAVIHVPRHGVPAGASRPLPAGVAERTAEARLVLQQALQSPTVRHLVALGSAFVYRLEPGNANRLTEQSALDLDPDVPPALRSWIDCDMLFHGELHNEALTVALLRLPPVVGSGGYVFFHPSLEGAAGPRWRPLGFDPLVPVLSDKDAARAAHRAVRSGCAGVFNVAGHESLPLSVLARWTGRGTWSVPGPLLHGVARAAALLGGASAGTAVDGAYLRYGFSLDTRRAERELGFRPAYRVGLSRAGDGRVRVETARA